MKPFYTSAIILSIALHIVIAIVLMFGNFSHEKPKETPKLSSVQPIEAVVLDRAKVEAQINKIKRAESAEKKRLAELENRAEAAKRKRAKEERRIKKLEKQRKQKLAEKKKADAAAKKAKAKAAIAEKARKKKVQEQKKAEAAAKKSQQAAEKAKKQRIEAEQAAKKAEALRIKQEQDKKRKAQEAKERAEQQQLLEQQMASEMAERQKAKQQQVMSEVQRYTVLILETIKRNLIVDQSTMAGKSCRVEVKLASSGFVINVKTSNGEPSVCAAAKTAVYKAGNLPVSKDPEVFKQLSTIGLTVDL